MAENSTIRTEMPVEYPGFVPVEDCKFCDFADLKPTIYDAPELLISHGAHMVSRLSLDDPGWELKVRIAADFVKAARS